MNTATWMKSGLLIAAIVTVPAIAVTAGDRGVNNTMQGVATFGEPVELSEQYEWIDFEFEAGLASLPGDVDAELQTFIETELTQGAQPTVYIMAWGEDDLVLTDAPTMRQADQNLAQERLAAIQRAVAEIIPSDRIQLFNMAQERNLMVTQGVVPPVTTLQRGVSTQNKVWPHSPAQRSWDEQMGPTLANSSQQRSFPISITNKSDLWSTPENGRDLFDVLRSDSFAAATTPLSINNKTGPVVADRAVSSSVQVAGGNAELREIAEIAASYRGPGVGLIILRSKSSQFAQAY